jgi:hypothetical protein
LTAFEFETELGAEACFSSVVEGEDGVEEGEQKEEEEEERKEEDAGSVG